MEESAEKLAWQVSAKGSVGVVISNLWDFSQPSSYTDSLSPHFWAPQIF